MSFQLMLLLLIGMAFAARPFVSKRQTEKSSQYSRLLGLGSMLWILGFLGLFGVGLAIILAFVQPRLIDPALLSQLDLMTPLLCLVLGEIISVLVKMAEDTHRIMKYLQQLASRQGQRANSDSSRPQVVSVPTQQ